MKNRQRIAVHAELRNGQTVFLQYVHADINGKYSSALNEIRRNNLNEIYHPAMGDAGEIVKIFNRFA